MERVYDNVDYVSFEKKLYERKQQERHAQAVRAAHKKKENQKLSALMALIMGFILSLELILAGAMIMNVDLMSTDGIALILLFMVVYSGVIVFLTDN